MYIKLKPEEVLQAEARNCKCGLAGSLGNYESGTPYCDKKIVYRDEVKPLYVRYVCEDCRREDEARLNG